VSRWAAASSAKAICTSLSAASPLSPQRPEPGELLGIWPMYRWRWGCCAAESAVAGVDLRGIMFPDVSNWASSTRCYMTDLRHHFRLAWIALVAIVGILSFVVMPRRPTTSGPPRNGARACCLKRVCTVCCCTPASASSAPSTTERSMALTPRGSGLSTPARPCECRSSEPGAPASRQESRSSEDRARPGAWRVGSSECPCSHRGHIRPARPAHRQPAEIPSLSPHCAAC